MQINATKVFTYGGLRAEHRAAVDHGLSHYSQGLIHRKILSRSAFTGTENCVPPEMSAMMNDHAVSITTTN